MARVALVDVISLPLRVLKASFAASVIVIVISSLSASVNVELAVPITTGPESDRLNFRASVDEILSSVVAVLNNFENWYRTIARLCAQLYSKKRVLRLTQCGQYTLSRICG